MQASKGTRVSEIAMFVILACVIVVPLISMFANIKGADFSAVFKGQAFWEALGNSLLSSLISTVISIVIAYALAWAVNRTNIKLKALWSVILVLPMLIPSISHGSGLIMLFGNNGIFTNLFGGTSKIYGLTGIVIGSVLYSFPVAFLMISDVLKYQDYSPYAAAEVMGIKKSRQFTAITLPYMKKPIISVLFATFTMVITDYGVPLSVGGHFKTLPVILFEEAVGQLNYSVGGIIGIVLLVPAVIAFLVDLFNKDVGQSTKVAQPFVIEKNKARDAVAYVVSTLIVIFTCMIFVAFCVQAFTVRYPQDMSFTFANFTKTFEKKGLQYLGNSILIAVLTAGVGTLVAFILAYLTARTKTKSSKFLHLLTITSLAIPGLVLGLSYSVVFKQSFVYGTLAILIMVNSVHFLASPYLMMYNALNKVHENLEDVGAILGISRMRVITQIIVPQTKYTIMEMASYFFVNCMMTISAVSFLATPSNKPLSLLINQFEAYSMMECAAVVALLILGVNLLIKIVVGIIKRKGGAKDVK